MINELKELIKNKIFNAIVELEYVDESIIKSQDDIVLEIPKDKANGDYSTNTAMRLARVAKKKPLDIAHEIVEKLNMKELNLSDISVAVPGFINLTIDKKYLLNIILKINKEQDAYGNADFGKNERVCLEYVSANPTGYLHVGHGRGAAYGDSLARIMKKVGYNVHREYYVNDAGNQITNMAYSVYERYKELFGYEIEMKNDYYFGKEIIEVAKTIQEEYGDKFLDAFDLEFFKNYGTNKLLDNLKKDLEKFNVNFDTWFSEKSLYQNKAVEQVIDKLKKAVFTYEKDGALWLKTTDFED